MAITKLQPEGLAKPVDLDDNEQLRLGTGNDLQLFHNGTNSHIHSTTGELDIRSDDFHLRNAANNENMIVADADGAVELYYNNSKKLETTDIGLTVTGDLKILDGEQLRLGTGNDLMVHHDGTNSWVDNSTGDLYVRNTATNEHLTVQAGAGGNVYLRPNYGESGVAAIHNGAVELYYDNSKKFQTQNHGVDVIGLLQVNGNVAPQANNTHDLGTTSEKWAEVHATTYYGDGSNLTGVSSVGGATGVDFNDNVKARFGAGHDLELYHDGSTSYVRDSGTGNLRFPTSKAEFRNNGDTQTLAAFIDGGACELYHNDTKKFETESTGINVISATPLLNFNANNVAQCAQFQVSESSGGGVLIFKNKHTSGNLEEAYRINNNGTMSFSGAGTPNSSKLSIANNGTHITCRSFATGGYDSIFFRSANTNVGKIHFNSGGTQYHTSSDYRRKDNIVNLTGAIDRVKLLKPKRFNFKTDSSTTLDGFLAHEVTPAVPEAIQGIKDQIATEKDVTEGRAEEVGDPIYQTIDQSALVPLLTGALKELIAKVEVLEAA